LRWTSWSATSRATPRRSPPASSCLVDPANPRFSLTTRPATSSAPQPKPPRRRRSFSPASPATASVRSSPSPTSLPNSATTPSSLPHPPPSLADQSNATTSCSPFSRQSQIVRCCPSCSPERTCAHLWTMFFPSSPLTRTSPVASIVWAQRPLCTALGPTGSSNRPPPSAAKSPSPPPSPPSPRACSLQNRHLRQLSSPRNRSPALQPLSPGPLPSRPFCALAPNASASRSSAATQVLCSTHSTTVLPALRQPSLPPRRRP